MLHIAVGVAVAVGCAHCILLLVLPLVSYRWRRDLLSVLHVAVAVAFLVE